MQELKEAAREIIETIGQGYYFNTNTVEKPAFYEGKLEILHG